MQSFYSKGHSVILDQIDEKYKPYMWVPVIYTIRHEDRRTITRQGWICFEDVETLAKNVVFDVRETQFHKSIHFKDGSATDLVPYRVGSMVAREPSDILIQKFKSMDNAKVYLDGWFHEEPVWRKRERLQGMASFNYGTMLFEYNFFECGISIEERANERLLQSIGWKAAENALEQHDMKLLAMDRQKSEFPRMEPYSLNWNIVGEHNLYLSYARKVLGV